jgi:hypothetical protein
MGYMRKNISFKSVQVTDNEDGTRDIIAIASTDEIDRDGEKPTHVFLESMSKMIVGKPVLKEHCWDVDNIIGRVVEAHLENRKSKNNEDMECVVVKLDIQDEDAVEKIRDGRFSDVSPAFDCPDSDRIQREGYIELADCRDVYELSFVGVQAIPSASVIQKHKEKGGNIMNKFSFKSLFTKYPTLKSVVDENPNLIDDIKALDSKELTEEDINNLIAENEELTNKVAELTEKVKAYEDAETAKKSENEIDELIGALSEQLDYDDKTKSYIKAETVAGCKSLAEDATEDDKKSVVATVLEKYKDLGLVNDKAADDAGTPDEGADADKKAEDEGDEPEKKEEEPEKKEESTEKKSAKPIDFTYRNTNANTKSASGNVTHIEKGFI